MRLIDLLFSLVGRRLLCAAVIAFAWLGMCQPAAAAISCSASTRSVVIIYGGSAISGAGMVTQVACNGFTNQSAPHQFIMCTTSDAATAGYRIAKSVAGNTLNYQFTAATDFSATSLTSSGIPISYGSLGASVSGGNIVINTASRLAPMVNVPAQGTPTTGDYVAMVPLTVEIRTVDQSSSMTSCTEGTSVGLSVISLQVTIRVGGAACVINNVGKMDFGNVSVTSGTVQSNTNLANTATFEITCASGTSWTATFSDGNNPSGTGGYRRRMVNGSSYLTYGLSSSGSRGTNTPDDPVSLSGTGTGTNGKFSLRGMLPSQTPASLTPGLYTDTVIMSVTY